VRATLHSSFVGQAKLQKPPELVFNFFIRISRFEKLHVHTIFLGHSWG